MPAKSERVLLVEGKDDKEVVYQFCNHHKINNKELFSVEEKDGYENLLDDLEVRPHSVTEVIGAIVDADADPHRRWQAIRGRILKSGYTDFPEEPSEGGTIIQGRPGLPTIGIWLMPNNGTAGILEDFLTTLVREEDVLLKRARCCVDGIPPEERRFVDTYQAKAVIHTWLAWQEDPGTPLDLAIKKRYLDAGHPLAIQFGDWLRNLFPVTR